jgi:predicted membrane protein
MNKRVLFAIILIVLGVTSLIGNIYSEFSIGWIIGHWWPSIIILFGLWSISDFKADSILWGSFLIVNGTLLQLNRLDILPWGFWSYFWPVLLIWIGISMFFKKHDHSCGRHNHGRYHRHGINRIIEKEGVSYINTQSMFAGVEEKFKSDDFRGGEVSVMFGSAEVDLRNSQMSPEATRLKVSAMFGEAIIFVPTDWNIIVRSSAMLGSAENKTINKINFDQPILEIKAEAMLGSVEIRN